MATGHAKAQVHPRGANPQAVFTSIRAGRDFFNLIEMSTNFGHISLQFKSRDASRQSLRVFAPSPFGRGCGPEREPTLILSLVKHDRSLKMPRAKLRTLP